MLPGEICSQQRKNDKADVPLIKIFRINAGKRWDLRDQSGNERCYQYKGQFPGGAPGNCLIFKIDACIPDSGRGCFFYLGINAIECPLESRFIVPV